jgi:small subunit ribosomal protein S1
MSMIVTGYNRGGLLVQGENISGFVPISHIVSLDHREINQNENLQKLVGQSIRLKLIECDSERGRIVFSERAAQSGPGTRKKILGTLQAGDCITGRVTNIKHFGIFVDLGGVEGLIHVSEISWGRVQHPNDAARIGQVIEVYVIQVDQASARIALSLKRLTPNPWLTVSQLYQPGQIIEAEITSLDTYGAFARLANGLDGLIHISEIESDKPLSHPKEMIQCGQKVKVRILHIDSSKKRLGLSLKLTDDPNQDI